MPWRQRIQYDSFNSNIQYYQRVYHDVQIYAFFVSTCKPLLKGATVGYGGKVTNVVG